MGAPEIDMRAEASVKSTDAPPEKRVSQRPSVMIEKVRSTVVQFGCVMVVMLFCFGALMFGVNIAAIYSQKDIAIDPYNVLTDTSGNALQVQIDHTDENPFDLPLILMETQELQGLESVQVHTDGGVFMSWTVSKIKFATLADDSYQLSIMSTAGDTLMWRPAVVEQEDGNFKWADSTPPTIEITEISGEKHVATKGTDRRLARKIKSKNAKKSKKTTKSFYARARIAVKAMRQR